VSVATELGTRRGGAVEVATSAPDAAAGGGLLAVLGDPGAPVVLVADVLVDDADLGHVRTLVAGRAAEAAQAGQGPGTILTTMNEVLLAEATEPVGCAAVAVIESGGSRAVVRLARAGHPPVFVGSREGGSTWLAPRGRPLGVVPDLALEEHVQCLEPGEVMLLHGPALFSGWGVRRGFTRERLERLWTARVWSPPTRGIAGMLVDDVSRALRAASPGVAGDDVALAAVALA
jgi:hypothetical protein